MPFDFEVVENLESSNHATAWEPSELLNIEEHKPPAFSGRQLCLSKVPMPQDATFLEQLKLHVNGLQ